MKPKPFSASNHSTVPSVRPAPAEPSGCTSAACGPRSPCTTSNSTRWPGSRVRKPPSSTMADQCTNTSAPPPSGDRNPKPFSVSKRLTEPAVRPGTAALPAAGRVAHRHDVGGLRPAVALHDVELDALPLLEAAVAGALGDLREVREQVRPAVVRRDEPEPLAGVEPRDRALRAAGRSLVGEQPHLGRLRPALAGHHLVLDPVALVQAGVGAVLADERRGVHEQVGAAVVGGQEAEALLAAEPQHGAGVHALGRGRRLRGGAGDRLHPRGLLPAVAVDDVELHALPLGQAAVPAVVGQRGEVHEQVGAAVVRRDEAEALAVVEPRDRPRRRGRSARAARCGAPPRRRARAPAAPAGRGSPRRSRTRRARPPGARRRRRRRRSGRTRRRRPRRASRSRSPCRR